MELKNKVAYITGGTKGIGKATAEVLLDCGMKVAISGRSNSVIDLSNQLNQKYPGRVMGINSDVRSLRAEQEAVSKITNEWASLDVLIANAGVGHFAPIDEMTEQQWNEVIDINLTGVFNSVKSSVESLKASKGYLITIASLAGTNFFAKGAAYNASKFGLVGFTQAVMMDLRQYGVKATTMMPGSVATHFNGNTPSEKDAWKIQPEDIGVMIQDILKMPARTLPSKIEMRPSIPPSR